MLRHSLCKLGQRRKEEREIVMQVYSGRAAGAAAVLGDTHAHSVPHGKRRGVPQSKSLAACLCYGQQAVASLLLSLSLILSFSHCLSSSLGRSSNVAAAQESR